MTVYNRWDDILSKSEIIILVATTEPALKVYRVTDQGIRQIGQYSLHYEAKELIFCHLERYPKVILVPKDDHIPIDIYNLEISPEKGLIW